MEGGGRGRGKGEEDGEGGRRRGETHLLKLLSVAIGLLVYTYRPVWKNYTVVNALIISSFYTLNTIKHYNEADN